jgi:hypothetical protein
MGAKLRFLGANRVLAGEQGQPNQRGFCGVMERAMGIEPTSEAWEACNLTQKTLDWRHFCDFRNALIGK